MTHQTAGARANAHWQPWEQELLVSDYATGNLNEIARRLGRSRKAIQWRAEKTGLRRNLAEARKARAEAGKKGAEVSNANQRDYLDRIVIQGPARDDGLARKAVAALSPLELAWSGHAFGSPQCGDETDASSVGYRTQFGIEHMGGMTTPRLDP